jgi:predicted component of type VI protein secretion system
VHDPLRVRGGQPLRQLQPQPCHLRLQQRPLGQVLRHHRSRHVLHHQEVEPVLGVEVEHHGDVGMSELGEGQRLAAEPLARRFVSQQAGQQQLERHVALQPLIARAPHFTHAAGANALDQAIVAQGEAGRGATVGRGIHARSLSRFA